MFIILVTDYRKNQNIKNSTKNVRYINAYSILEIV